MSGCIFLCLMPSNLIKKVKLEICANHCNFQNCHTGVVHVQTVLFKVRASTPDFIIFTTLILHKRIVDIHK